MLGSAISKVNRLTATRSRLVVTYADRMLTRSSESTRVTSESSRCRSSASTWIETTNVESADGAHSTSTQPLGLVEQRWPRWCTSAGAPTRSRRA